MNKTAILHIPESQYSFAYGEHELRIRLRAARGDLDSVTLIYAVKYDWLTERKSLPMRKSYSDELYDYYTAALSVPDPRTGYVFYLKHGEEAYYYSEEGLTVEYDHEKSYYNFFQHPYINAADVHRKVDWCDRAVFYQIFIDRFCCGDREKDRSYINRSWGEIPDAKSFYGGDLKGVTEKLGYLSDLGITALYLTPVFSSPSNHKYDTVDYYRVDEMFGSAADLKELVQRAHERGMKVVLDAVFNHCSMRCAQFQDVLKKGRSSRYHDWFIIRGDKPDPQNCNYECFAACSYMPKWNTSNEEVQEYLLRIALYWMRECGIDGWRLDVADEVSHDFWRRFRKAVKRENPQAILIGESWHDAGAWLRGDEFDGIMNYSFTKACIDYFAKGTRSVQSFCDRLNELLMRNTDQVNEMMLNLLDSHDTERFLTLAKENTAALCCALAVLFFFPGMPCICYGTEIGMIGEYEPDSRRTFDWNEALWDKSLQETVRTLALLRREKIGGAIRLYTQGELLVMERETCSLIVNFTNDVLTYAAHACYHVIGARSYVVIDKEESA